MNKELNIKITQIKDMYNVVMTTKGEESRFNVWDIEEMFTMIKSNAKDFFSE
jgi:hypothetical protein